MWLGVDSKCVGSDQINRDKENRDMDAVHRHARQNCFGDRLVHHLVLWTWRAAWWEG
jgi:hypothetical protein